METSYFFMHKYTLEHNYRYGGKCMGKSTFNIVTFDGGGLRGALSIGIFERYKGKFQI